MEGKNFNEVLKAREAEEAKIKSSDADEQVALDDTQRVKVLSPGRMVFNRFIRNRLAIVGTVILAFMFLFSFLFPVFYSYGQTDIFYKHDDLHVNYASAATRDSYTNYKINNELQISSEISNKMTSFIAQMEEAGKTTMEVADSETGDPYTINKLGDNVYELTGVALDDVASVSNFEKIAAFNTKTKKCMYNEGVSMAAAFDKAVADAIGADESIFAFGGVSYTVNKAGKNMYDVLTMENASFTMDDGSAVPAFEAAAMDALSKGEFEFEGDRYVVSRKSSDKFVISKYGKAEPLMVAGKLVFDAYEEGATFDDSFKAQALMALYGEGKFTYDSEDYTTKNDSGVLSVMKKGEPVALISSIAVRRYSGEDTLPIDFKMAAQEVITKMAASNEKTGSFEFDLPAIDENGNYVKDENGVHNTETSQITVTRKEGQYVLSCDQMTYLIDIYAPSSREHIFGTDADGMDVLARMMYGGRISLMVGFVVIILELIFGVVMGGLAGYFGGWVDTLIMRLVDIFNCIPTMPILIILGAMFDAQKLGSYARLMWMMAVLGFLGWAGVARLVRGQMLSLREQEFMTAAEATGLSTSRRIFKHLIPNVMPQLIVNATMGLGSVIIYESTLSFLGLGVKHPLATWGTMINSVTSSNENMIRYAYIWIPVGLLICLTVIAFNFVGDGLRDAFDPKMK